ncbi:hypothetical protein, partial [Rhizobium leguminosarum]
GAIGVDIHEQPHRNLLELAKLNGKATVFFF